jgi:hypothetical protein
LDAAWHHQYHLLRTWVATRGDPQQLLEEPPPPPQPAAGSRPSNATQQQQQQEEELGHQEQQQEEGKGAFPGGSTLTAKEVYDLSCWLTRQAELYRLVKLTPLKTKLLRAAGEGALSGGACRPSGVDTGQLGRD